MKANRIALFVVIAFFATALPLAAAPFAADPAATDVTVDIAVTRAGVEPNDITVYAGQNVTLNVTCVSSFSLTGIVFKLDEFGISKVLGNGSTGTFTFTVEKIGEYRFYAGHYRGILKVLAKPEK